MTPRAWSYGLLFAGILWAALIVAWWLIMAAGTVGVEAWHDSALPQGAFVEVKSPTGGTAGLEVAGLTSIDPAAGQRLRRSAGPVDATVPPSVKPFPSPRAVPRLAAVRPVAAVARTVTGSGSESMTGTASWFASPANVSAAGPALRAALGSGWRGTVVTVTANGVSVRTQLGDWCQCYGTRLLDLDRSDFARLAPLSQGLQEVSIEW